MTFTRMLMIVCLVLAGCEVDQQTGEEVLSEEGYHDIRLTGYSFACGEDDTFRSTFRARRTVLEADGSHHEIEVQGSLCCGWLKDCTVRHSH